MFFLSNVKVAEDLQVNPQSENQRPAAMTVNAIATAVATVSDTPTRWRGLDLVEGLALKAPVPRRDLQLGEDF
jgi:hypothetical protein